MSLRLVPSCVPPLKMVLFRNGKSVKIREIIEIYKEVSLLHFILMIRPNFWQRFYIFLVGRSQFSPLLLGCLAQRNENSVDRRLLDNPITATTAERLWLEIVLCSTASISRDSPLLPVGGVRYMLETLYGTRK